MLDRRNSAQQLDLIPIEFPYSLFRGHISFEMLSMMGLKKRLRTKLPI